MNNDILLKMQYKFDSVHLWISRKTISLSSVLLNEYDSGERDWYVVFMTLAV